MALLTKMSIIDTVDLKRERVSVPEWGEDAEVIIQEISALERDRLRSEIFKDGSVDAVNIAAKVLVRCLIDDHGSRLFVDEEAEALGRKSVAVIDRLFDIAKRLNNVFADESADVKN